MKLCMPAGLENSVINESVSPTIGQPSLPGIAAISRGPEAHLCNKAETASQSIIYAELPPAKPAVTVSDKRNMKLMSVIIVNQ